MNGYIVLIDFSKSFPNCSHEVINSIHYDIEALGHINGGEVVENYIEATCDNEGSYD